MTEPLTIRLPDGMRHQVKVAAAQLDISMNEWIVRAIKEKLGGQEEKQEEDKEK